MLRKSSVSLLVGMLGQLAVCEAAPRAPAFVIPIKKVTLHVFNKTQITGFKASADFEAASSARYYEVLIRLDRAVRVNWQVRRLLLSCDGKPGARGAAVVRGPHPSTGLYVFRIYNIEKGRKYKVSLLFYPKHKEAQSQSSVLKTTMRKISGKNKSAVVIVIISQ